MAGESDLHVLGLYTAYIASFPLAKLQYTSVTSSQHAGA